MQVKRYKRLVLGYGYISGGYSIIEQNKVEELVYGNPEIRREFFEEAAGVAKLQGQKRKKLCTDWKKLKPICQGLMIL
jgi:chromosome segregation protein